MLQEIRDQLDIVGTDLNVAIGQLEQRLRDLGPLDDTWCGDIGFIKFDNRWALVHQTPEQVLLLVDSPIAVRVDSVPVLQSMPSLITAGQQGFLRDVQQATASIKILAKTMLVDPPKP